MQKSFNIPYGTGKNGVSGNIESWFYMRKIVKSGYCRNQLSTLISTC